MRDNRFKLGLGTVQFGMKYGISNLTGQTSEMEVARILARFKSLGGKVVDTASAYGTSESILGAAGVSSFVLVSKFMPPEVCKQSVSDQLAASLNRLKLKKIYGYLAHRPDSLIRYPEQWEELQKLKKLGLITKAGLSLTSADQWDQLKKLNIQPDIIQAPFNYFDRRFESIMKECGKLGVEVHARSAYLQGLFFRDPGTLSSFFSEVKPLLLDLQRSHKNLNGKLLSFVLNQPFIGRVITGVESEEQLNLNYNNITEEPGLPEFHIELSESILNPANWPSK